MVELVWLIPALPLAGFVALVVFGRSYVEASRVTFPFGRDAQQLLVGLGASALGVVLLSVMAALFLSCGKRFGHMQRASVLPMAAKHLP